MENIVRNIGGVTFKIYGVGTAFNNETTPQIFTNHFRLLGFDYLEIWNLAEKIQIELQKEMRISNVSINNTFTKSPTNEEFFILTPNKEFISSLSELTPKNIGYIWDDIDISKDYFGILNIQNQDYKLRLSTTNDNKTNIWNLINKPINSESTIFKPNNFFDIVKSRGSLDITKHNGRYQLFVEFEFVGTLQLANKIIKQHIDTIKKQLPSGYSLEDVKNDNWWKESGTKLSYLVVVAIVLMILICCLLLNSLRQSLLALIIVLPAFTGMFYTIYFFNIPFDQGGFVAFLLVAGLSINSMLYIVNDVNNLQKSTPKKNKQQLFIKAFNLKIASIWITVISTILGLIPFIIFDKPQPFWFTLSACTIAGLISSMISVYLLLPIFQLSNKIDKTILKT